MNLDSFNKLEPRIQALVTLAVLINDQDAVEYFKLDEYKAEELKAASAYLFSYAQDVRSTLAASYLRSALNKITDK